MRRLGSPCLLLLVLAAVASCGERGSPAAPGRADGKLVVATTFFPTTFFTRRLAGDLADVRCPLPPGEDPIFWQPDDEALRTYQQADLVVINGAGFEHWVARVSLPPSRVVDTARPFADQLITFARAVVHSHGPAGAHTHEGIDGHTWLDPVQARIQAGEIAKALERLRPSARKEIEERRRALDVDLDGIDEALRELTRAREDEAPILASHPAYDYLARRYGWTVINLALDPGTDPTDEEIDAIRREIEGQQPRFLIWESEPKPGIATRMREALGVESVVVSPVETEEAAGGRDYLAVWQDNLEALGRVLGDRP